MGNIVASVAGIMVGKIPLNIAGKNMGIFLCIFSRFKLILSISSCNYRK